MDKKSPSIAGGMSFYVTRKSAPQPELMRRKVVCKSALNPGKMRQIMRLCRTFVCKTDLHPMKLRRKMRLCHNICRKCISRRKKRSRRYSNHCRGDTYLFHEYKKLLLLKQRCRKIPFSRIRQHGDNRFPCPELHCELDGAGNIGTG